MRAHDLALRVLGAAVFGFEAVAIVEGLTADAVGRPRRFPTASHYCWKHPRYKVLLMGALAVHLYRKPDDKLAAIALALVPNA